MPRIKKTTLMQQLKDKAILAYKKGRSIREIEERYLISRQVLYRRLHKQGVKLRRENYQSDCT